MTRQAGLEPASRHSRHRALRAGHERARWRAPGDQALLQRDAVRALSRKRSRPTSAAPNRCRATRTARRGPCARRSPSFTGSIPRASSAAPAPTSCSIFLPPPISGRATRRSTSRHGFLVYKIAILGRGATPVVAPETDLTSRCRRHPRLREPANARGVHRQPEQSRPAPISPSTR